MLCNVHARQSILHGDRPSGVPRERPSNATGGRPSPSQQTLPRDDKRWASDLIPVRMAAVQDWSIEDVGRWICTEPIETASDVAELFAREEIDGRALLCYAAGARDLKQDLGLSVGKVTILMRGIHELADDESTHTVSSSSAQVPAQGPGKSARHILSAAEIRVNAHEQSGEVEKLFESYSHYWEIVALADGLCGTMAVVLVEATDEDDMSALTATFGAAFGLAFILSMAGLSLCVLNLVQFGFALDKAAFINRYSVRNQLQSQRGCGVLLHPTLLCQMGLTIVRDVRGMQVWMELPSALLIVSGLSLIVGVCARAFSLYRSWVAIMLVSLSSLLFPGLLLLRRSMKTFVVNQLGATTASTATAGGGQQEQAAATTEGTPPPKTGQP